jgi:hypothetical protein
VLPAGAQSSTDLFDISQGTVLTAHSPVRGELVFAGGGVSDARNILGGAFGTIEPGNTIFEDQQPLDFVHFIEFRTPSLVAIDQVDLYASGDFGAPYGSDFRDFGEFRLYAATSAGGPFALVTDLVPSHPAPHGVVPFSFTFGAPVVGQFFRAEFVQYPVTFFGGGYTGGPRIKELDAFGRAVPEPGTLSLLLMGGLGAAGVLKRRRA